MSDQFDRVVDDTIHSVTSTPGKRYLISDRPGIFNTTLGIPVIVQKIYAVSTKEDPYDPDSKVAVTFEMECIVDKEVSDEIKERALQETSSILKRLTDDFVGGAILIDNAINTKNITRIE